MVEKWSLSGKDVFKYLKPSSALVTQKILKFMLLKIFKKNDPPS